MRSDKVTLGIRVSPALKRKLMASAEANGRNLSEEVCWRLERSFLTYISFGGVYLDNEERADAA